MALVPGEITVVVNGIVAPVGTIVMILTCGRKIVARFLSVAEGLNPRETLPILATKTPKDVKPSVIMGP